MVADEVRTWRDTGAVPPKLRAGVAKKKRLQKKDKE